MLQGFRETLLQDDPWSWCPANLRLPRKRKKHGYLEERAQKLLLKDIHDRWRAFSTHPDVPLDILLRCLHNGWGWSNPSVELLLLTHPPTLGQRLSLASGLLFHVHSTRGYRWEQLWDGMQRDPGRWLPRIWPYEELLRALWPWGEPPPT